MAIAMDERVQDEGTHPEERDMLPGVAQPLPPIVLPPRGPSPAPLLDAPQRTNTHRAAPRRAPPLVPRTRLRSNKAVLVAPTPPED